MSLQNPYFFCDTRVAKREAISEAVIVDKKWEIKFPFFIISSNC